MQPLPAATLVALPAPTVVPLFGLPTQAEREHREAAEGFAAMLSDIADLLGPSVLAPYAGQRIWRCGRYVDCTEVQRTV